MRKLGIALIITLLSSPLLASSSYKCPTGNFVHTGFTKSEVRAKCGSPLASDYEGVIKVRGKLVYIDRWTYPGGAKGYKILEFHDSKLRKIID